MARRDHRLTPEERERARRVLIALAVAAVLVMAVVIVAWAPWERHQDRRQGEHEHLVAPHGGTLTSLGLGEPHDHAEALLGPGGSLEVYTLRHDATTPRPIDRQLLTAWVRASVDDKPARVLLVPMPLPDDPARTTSRFKGRLGEALWGRDLLSVTVPSLAVADGRFRVEFAGVKTPGDLAAHQAGERGLFLTPGGKYGQADIEANGRTTPARKFADHEADHDLDPRTAGWLCPVASARSEPGVTWAVGGRDYRFCCSVCVDEFVQVAKDRPERIKPPEAYRVR